MPIWHRVLPYERMPMRNNVTLNMMRLVFYQTGQTDVKLNNLFLI